MLTACPTGGNTGKGGTGTGTGNGDTSDVDFTNHTASGDYLVKVKNNTSKRLVAFKGSINAANLIGGVPAGANGHGLEKKSDQFGGTSGDFILSFITEEQYNANKNDLASLDNTPFTRLYAFHNATGSNDKNYEVSGKLGGSSKVVIQNSTDFNMELRMNGIHGETLGYAPYQHYNTTLSMANGDYIVFPVFRRYNPALQEIMTVYPKFSGGQLDGQPKSTQFALTANSTHQIIASDFSGATFDFTSGSSYLIVQNNNGGTGIALYKGGTIEETASGYSTINTGGNSHMFEIPMDRVGSIFQNQRAISAGTYKVGPFNNQQPLPAHTYVEDKIYTVIIQGADASNVIVGSIDETANFNPMSVFD